MYLLSDLRGCTRFLLMLCLAFVPLGVAAGEAADPPLFVQVRTTYIQPGMATKFEEFLTRLNAARQKAGDDRATFVTRSRTGRSAYYGITLYDRYSDLQGSGLGSLFNEQELAEVTGLISESVRGGMVQTFFARQDLGRQAGVAPLEADAFLTLLVTVKPGQGFAYEQALMKLVEATEKVAPDLGWIAYAPDMSSANVYRFVIPWSWETIDDPGMSIPERYTKAFGEDEGMKWLNQLNEGIESVTTTMTIARQDLSYTPAE